MPVPRPWYFLGDEMVGSRHLLALAMGRTIRVFARSLSFILDACLANLHVHGRRPVARGRVALEKE